MIGIRFRLGQHFPGDLEVFRKLFNKNNLKLSYSCSPNLKRIIDGHNKTILKQNPQPEDEKPPNPATVENQTKAV